MLQFSLTRFFGSWFYPVIIVAAWFLTKTPNHPYLYCILATLSFIASLLLFDRFRTFHDTPISNLTTTTQGYVGLTVKAMPAPGEMSAGPMDLPPLVWFSRHHRTSKVSFMIEDEFGNATVDPSDAEIITPFHGRQQKWFHGIFPGETIYVLGQLKSTSFYRTDAQKRSASLGLLSFWKGDSVEMLRRFDRNNDGHIDHQELLLARDAAETVIETELDYQYTQSSSHNIDKPSDFRPFIISSIPLETLQQRFKHASFLHLLAWVLFSILAVSS